MEKLMKGQKRRHLAYLVRLWQVWDKGQADWRTSVENAHTGERRRFAGLEELFAVLENERSGCSRPARAQ